jgi:glyoxylase-like metal-dependent hydrolase (beta-lactamase superfamily II)
MSSSPLSIDVYVAPMRQYTCSDQLGEGEVATWAPSSSTLISGPTEGILIDALLTFDNADQIAGWAKRFGKKIAGVYITHGHSHHWLGLARLLQHFPEARGYAAPEVRARAGSTIFHVPSARAACRRTSRPASGTCVTSAPSRRKAARWRAWSTACSRCTASATSRTPSGSQPDPKSRDGHHRSESLQP